MRPAVLLLCNFVALFNCIAMVGIAQQSIKYAFVLKYILNL